MLQLKRVEIQGFKSFYDRTEMKFDGSGIAAVVGPNGCGKSNLSDAISWVLGEQSAKTLRGVRMEDVIFAGTRDRKALGMASVTMTLAPGATLFANASNGTVKQAEAAGHADGVTITRRLYRSGESEYLVNGKLARLRDIQDLFLGTGLGPESYAIIEQGRIGQILSNKPQDRRAVVEEAAGVTKFKTRKRLAEAKLESAKQNLSRVFDILEEVTRQVNSLKRQAAKTKRYGELRTEGIRHLRQILAAKFRLLERESAKVAIELNLVSSELQARQNAIAEREAEQTNVLESSYATELELTDARKRLADLHLDAERARGRLEYQLKQVEQIERRLEAGEQESNTLEGQQQDRVAELESHAVQLGALESECGAARQALEQKTVERQDAQQHLAAQESGLEGVRQRVLRLLGESSGLKNRITQTEAQLAAADRDRERAEGEAGQSQNDLGRIQTVKAELSERLTAQQIELISITDQRKAIEEELRQKKGKLAESRQAWERNRSELSRVKARRDSLEEVIQHRSYTTETVKGLFTAVAKGRAHDLRPVGVLADFLEVDTQVEKATEEFLHDELEYVVVRDWAEAERGIELMRTDLNGRATFLVESVREHGTETPELPELAAEPGILTKLTDALRFTNGLTKLPLHTLPRIENCYVVNERALGQELAMRFPQCWFLTADGVNYHGQTVSGGKKTGAGPLALKRELREMSRLEETKKQEVSAAQEAVGGMERYIADGAEHLEGLRSKQQAQEKDVLALDHESRKLAEEFQRIQQRLSRARLELDRLSRDRVGAEEKLRGDHEALANLETQRAQQERALESAREELTHSQANLARISEEHANLRANLASLEERRRSAAANKSRVEGQVEEVGKRREFLAAEMRRLIGERVEFLSNNADLEVKGADLKAEIAQRSGSVQSLAEQEAELRGRLAEAEEQLKRLRQEAQASQEKRSDLQVKLARSESDAAHLQETCQKELETTVEELAAGDETVPDEAGIAGIEERYAEVRRKIDALGPVNSQALEEFEEAQNRQEFLSVQRQDLLDSIRDTEKAIHEIDNESRKRFGEAFQAINEHFKEMFRVLFGGGTGEMRLTDEGNLAESGIDIVASPPGKKLQSVLLLSGGEKSLTAMALLMAVFQYTPSPFCILDEVDAPLDEPNIERLTKLLQQMAEQTQFIVITHAKRTMEAAQSLYGVTMQEPGVSKLVSVKLPGAEMGRRSNLRREAAQEAEAQPVLV